MLFSAEFTIDPNRYYPKWTGSKWVYNRKEYRSLRQLKTKSSYKLEEKLANTLVMQITKEIDAEMIAHIKSKIQNKPLVAYEVFR